ncbi:MAG: hypothetical protein WAV98_02820 [Minisyncoccia bacterium]
MQNTYNKQTAKFLAMVAQNMPEMSADVMQGWIQNPKALKKALTILSPLETTSRFEVWKTIRLGTSLKTADDFRAAIKIAGMYIGDWGNDILSKPVFTASTEETEIDLVVVSNADLGFRDGAELKDTYARALELGLDLCPNEVGPQLRLQYTDQPIGEWLLIAMEPIVDSDGNRILFHVERRDGGSQYLYGSHGDPVNVWHADARFVFRRRK